MNDKHQVHSRIVLVGGGHAHVQVVRDFGLRPEPGVELTLVSRDDLTPYSGMVPGVVAGLYRLEQAQIDLRRLAAAFPVKFIRGEVVGLDRIGRRILFAGREPLPYDVVSIDVGIASAVSKITGARQHGIVVKPIASFLSNFEQLRTASQSPDGPRRIVTVGGGAGGVELLLAIRSRLLADARTAGGDPDQYRFMLVTDGEILTTHNRCVRAAFRRLLRQRGIALHEHRRVVALRAGALETADGTTIAADAVLITTDAAAPPWFRSTGLALDASGFLSVGSTLQSTNDPDVFAAGDCAALSETPRPKAGVFAVRAGPPLADNLRRHARGETPRPWRPQRHYLALISTGERYAVASRGWIKAEGRWIWSLKDWIDRSWMKPFQKIGPAPATPEA